MFVPLTPLRFLHRAVDLFGKKIGVVSGTRQFPYREFGERCERLAGALADSGIGGGDRVAYLSYNNHQLLEGYFGVIQCGAVVMPLNVRLAEPELLAILNHAGARALLYEPEFTPLVERLRASCQSIRLYVRLDGEYEDLLAQARPERADILRVDENSLAELFYTSGSTGTPKGVMLTHRTLYLHAMAVATVYRNVESMVDLHTIPLFHANGWGHPQASTMLGIKQVMVRRFEPAAVFQLIQEHRATDMSLVPTMANALLNAPDLKSYDLSSLRETMIGGAAASPELIARFEAAFHCQCVAGYGLTETAPVLTMARHKSTVKYASETDRQQRQAMAGWPLPGVEVRVVDENLHDVARDMTAIGEVVARGDHVMAGYFEDKAGTAAVMAGGWFHTGDMAVWDDEGYIHIVDRKKEIIISGGENISSIEVEKAIYAHVEVFECAVVAAPDEKWGEIPVAIVVRKPGSALAADALCEFLGGRLAKYKMPRRIEFSEEPLPKTGTGKIRKNILKERFWAGKERRVQG
ncbi:MAG TPA: long-chain-fatty-acid--CoA ligase [Bryobacteraceae bacterium]|nr:long-chain-fatty-acid--CoA ligase [Bryobacteraceae bacterium]